VRSTFLSGTCPRGGFYPVSGGRPRVRCDALCSHRIYVPVPRDGCCSLPSNKPQQPRRLMPQTSDIFAFRDATSSWAINVELSPDEVSSHPLDIKRSPANRPPSRDSASCYLPYLHTSGDKSGFLLIEPFLLSFQLCRLTGKLSHLILRSLLQSPWMQGYEIK
jgi:hypothetical protein